jgi:hypothetical protein
VDQAAANVGKAAPAAAAVPAAAPAPADCKAARKRMIGLRVARKKAGKPPLGEMAFQSSGEVAYAAGAEPTAEEEAVMNKIKSCSGQTED